MRAAEINGKMQSNHFLFNVQISSSLRKLVGTLCRFAVFTRRDCNQMPL